MDLLSSIRIRLRRISWPASPKWGWLALLFGFGLWQCDLIDPPTPVLHRWGIDTVWDNQDTVINTTIQEILTEDTLWNIKSILSQPGPDANHDLDSTIYTYDIYHFQVRALNITRIARQTGHECQTDSGGKDNTAEPIRSQCKPVSRSVGSPIETTGVDTLWTDTTSHVKREGKDLGPRIGPTPAIDTLRATLVFPETLLPPYAIANSNHSTVSLESGSWSGVSKFNSTYDTLQLIWPQPTSTAEKTLSSLGNLKGLLKTKANQMSASRPYTFKRVMRGLVPAGNSLEDWWQVQHGLHDTPISDAFSPDAAFQRFGMATDPMGQDSLLHLRSRFSLRGNFEASIHMVLPPQSDTGCFVSWLFAAAEEEPFILFEKAVKTTPARFTMLSSAAGFYVNTTGRLNPPVTIIRSGASATSTWKGSFPKEAILNAQRRNNEVTIRICNLTQDTCTAMVSTSDPGDPPLAQDLQIQWTVGGFGKKAFQVLWSDFMISEGILVHP